MWDFYQRYFVPFGEVLTDMERAGAFLYACEPPWRGGMKKGAVPQNHVVVGRGCVCLCVLWEGAHRHDSDGCVPLRTHESEREVTLHTHEPVHTDFAHTDPPKNKLAGIRVDAKTYLAGVQKQAEQDKINALERCVRACMCVYVRSQAYIYGRP